MANWRDFDLRITFLLDMKAYTYAIATIQFQTWIFGHPAARLANPVSVILKQQERLRVMMAVHPTAKLASPMSVI